MPCLALISCDSSNAPEQTTKVETTAVEETTTTEETTDGYTVEESEWADLFAGTNLTLDFVPQTQEGWAYEHQNLKYDGDKIYYYTVYTNIGIEDLFFEFVLEGESRICYIYDQASAEDDWMKVLDERGLGKRMISDLNLYFYSFAGKYSSFEYDAENKQYTAESITVAYSGREFIFTDICVKFEGGKLSEITYIVSGMKVNIDNVGTTSVSLPALSE
jgi:hypothetical protein